MESFPTSPSYWQLQGKQIRALIRQIGLPIFFITLSSAETKWGELLRILKKVSDNEIISIEDALKLPFVEKSRLIKGDPTTSARYFDHRMRAMLRFIRSKHGIFKDFPCHHHYWRIEVQQQGSLHLHGLFWLKNVPVIHECFNGISL